MTPYLDARHLDLAAPSCDEPGDDYQRRTIPNGDVRHSAAISNHGNSEAAPFSVSSE
jgi:hypothetical protein